MCGCNTCLDVWSVLFSRDKGLAVLSLSRWCLVFVETLSLMPGENGHGHVIADVLWSCMDSLWSCLNMNLAIDDCKAKVLLRHPCIHSASSTQKLYCVEHRRLCGQFVLALASFPDSTPQLFITLCIKLAGKFCHVKCVGCIDVGSREILICEVRWLH